MTPSVADLTRLEELARAATPGPWRAWEHSKRIIYNPRIAVARVYVNHGHLQGENNAAYIAACSPEVILALVRVARAAVELHGHNTAMFEDNCAACTEFTQAVESLQALK